MTPPLDAVVVGAGFAGLTVSRALAVAGAEHVVLERGRIGESWRSQRWDSFRLNSPRHWHNPCAAWPQGFASAGELVGELERSAVRLPVREGVDVLRVDRHLDSWHVHTSDGLLRARSVIAATGALNAPRRPAWTTGLTEVHAGEYRNADALPDGVVVVVGGGQSGAQIAADLLAAGRRVYLTTSRVGRLPRRYRGRDISHWQVATGRFTQRPDESRGRGGGQPLLGPGGDLSYEGLARAGATLLGRAEGAADGRLLLARDVRANLAHAAAVAHRFRDEVDSYIAREGITAPPAEPDPADDPPPGLDDGPAELDLRRDGVGAVVFATGFGPAEPAWLGPGVHRVGAEWQHTRSSSTLYGIRREAPRTARSVLERPAPARARRPQPVAA